MHFSSATPAGQVLSLTERHAKSVQSPSATSSQSPKIPNCTPASQWLFFFPHTFRKGLGARNSAPSTCPRGATRAVQHPWDGQTSAILFSNSMVSPNARQKNHAFSQSIQVLLQSKQQKSSPGFSAKLSHQFKIGCHLEPFTTRQDSDAYRGPVNSLATLPARWKWRLGSLFRS